jgi:hypothetical protein
VESTVQTVDGPQPFSSTQICLRAGTSATDNRVCVEISRLGEVRMSWRTTGSWSLGNWQGLLQEDSVVRVLTDGTQAWGEIDATGNGTWEGLPLDLNGYTRADDRITIDLSPTPQAAVGCISNETGASATCVVERLHLVSQCAEPSIDNATLIVPGAVAQAFQGTETIRVLDPRGRCLAQDTVQTTAFAMALVGDDDITPDSTEGAIPGETLTVQVNGESVSPPLTPGEDIWMTDWTYQHDVVYEPSNWPMP